MSFGVDTDELNRASNLSAFLASKKAAIDVEVLESRPSAGGLVCIAISGFWAGARPSACGRGPADSVSPGGSARAGVHPLLTRALGWRSRASLAASWMAVPRKPCCLSRAISFCLEVPCR